MNPKVSITMPVLNGERYIGRAIQSIAAQTYKDFELIVVDDGSTDRTRECVEAFRDVLRLKYVKHERNQGIAKSVNDGLRNSDGEYIAFLDHDDCWLPDFLETQVAYLESHADVAMVHSDYQITDGDDRLVCESVARWMGKTRPSGHVFPALFQESFVVGNSVLIRKPVIQRFGGFNEQLPFGDYHLWMRIAKNYKVDYVNRPLTQYRQHTSQTIRNVSQTRPESSPAALVIQAILDEYPDTWTQLGKTTVRRRFASVYFDLAYSSFLAGTPAHARACLFKALPLWPLNFRYHSLFLATLMPPRLGTGLRRGWRWVRRVAAGGATKQAPADAATEVWR